MPRQWAAGAAIMVCLALGGAPALAQSPQLSMTAPAAWAAVSGTSTCAPPTGGSEHLDAAPYTASGLTYSCTNTATDPRVAGPSTMTYSVQSWDDRVKASGASVLYNAAAWMSYVISGPDGTWTGDAHGLYDNDGVLRIVAILAGGGAYEGMIFTWSGTVPANSLSADMIGVIQPGSLPPDFPIAAP